MTPAELWFLFLGLSVIPFGFVMLWWIEHDDRKARARRDARRE